MSDKKIIIDIGANFKEFYTDWQQAKSRTDTGIANMKKAFAAIGGAVGVSFGLSELMLFGKKSIEASMELEILRKSFVGNAKDIELFKKATAGTVTEANLLKLSNQASDLGITLEQQTILFALAEDAADKYGGGIEENFQKIIAATEGSARGLKSVGIQKAIYESILDDLTRARGKELSQLDAEEQKLLRVEALLRASGVTMDDVVTKTADAKDRYEQFGVAVEETVSGMGDFFRDAGRGMFDLVSAMVEGGPAGTAILMEMNLQADLLEGSIKNISEMFREATKAAGEMAQKNAIGKSRKQIEDLISTTKAKISALVSEYGTSPTDINIKNDLEQQQRKLAIYKQALSMRVGNGDTKKEKYDPLKEVKTWQANLAEVNALLQSNNLSLIDKNKLLMEQVRLAGLLYKIEHYSDKVDVSGLTSRGYDLSGGKIENKNNLSQTDVPEYGMPTGSDVQDYWSNQTDAIEEAQAASESFASNLSSGFAQGIMAGDSMTDIFKNAGEQFGEMILQALLYKAIMAGLNLIPGAGSALSWLGIGGKANGGYVSSTRPYIVGERGPELFMPSSNGFIMPNQQLRNISVSNNNSFNDRNIVSAIKELHSRFISLETTVKKYSGVNIDGKSISREITKNQNRDSRGNIKL